MTEETKHSDIPDRASVIASGKPKLPTQRFKVGARVFMKASEDELHDIPVKVTKAIQNDDRVGWDYKVTDETGLEIPGVVNESWLKP